MSIREEKEMGDSYIHIIVDMPEEYRGMADFVIGMGYLTEQKCIRNPSKVNLRTKEYIEGLAQDSFSKTLFTLGKMKATLEEKYQW